jgi:hypothetical protein
MKAGLVAVIFVMSAGPVSAVEPEDCAQRIDQDASLGKATPRWRFPAVAPDVMNGVTRAGKNPLVTRGDFDDDGHQDVAFLITTAAGATRVAVCLAAEPARVRYIDDLYCRDGIDTARKGARYHDFETETPGRYGRDGIAAYCYEQAGATYLLENGVFRRVVDSD